MEVLGRDEAQRAWLLHLGLFLKPNYPAHPDPAPAPAHCTETVCRLRLNFSL